MNHVLLFDVKLSIRGLDPQGPGITPVEQNAQGALGPEFPAGSRTKPLVAVWGFTRRS